VFVAKISSSEAYNVKRGDKDGGENLGIMAVE
jgi:hypothetical protein